MIKSVIVALSLITGMLIYNIANAQQSKSPEFIIKVDAQQLEIIGKGLGKLPFDDVAPLIQALRQQVIEQQNPKPIPLEPKK